MLHQALAGVMNGTGSEGRQPLYGIGHRAAYATGTTAYITVVSALYERRRSGRGQRARLTVVESLTTMGQNLVSQRGGTTGHGITSFGNTDRLE